MHRIVGSLLFFFMVAVDASRLFSSEAGTGIWNCVAYGEKQPHVSTRPQASQQLYSPSTHPLASYYLSSFVPLSYIALMFFDEYFSMRKIQIYKACVGRSCALMLGYSQNENFHPSKYRIHENQHIFLIAAKATLTKQVSLVLALAPTSCPALP